MTINYVMYDFEAEVKRLTDGAGIDLALDAVGGPLTESSMRCLARFGCLVNYGNASNSPASLPLSAFRDNRAAMGFSLSAVFVETTIDNSHSAFVPIVLPNTTAALMD